jgi:transposase
MRGQAGFFDVEERLKQLSAKGDSLERLSAVVDFERFRADLERAVVRSDRSRGGRPPFDHVLMFKVLILQSSHNLSDERTEYLIRDRLSFMRFLGLGLADTVPDANTIWGFREALTRARIAGKPAIEVVFERFDAVLATAGFLAMSGQIIDASIVAAPKQRNTEARSATSRKAAFRRHGLKSRPNCARRTAMRAGRSNTPRPNPAPRALRGLISQSQLLVTKITSASTAGIA